MNFPVAPSAEPEPPLAAAAGRGRRGARAGAGRSVRPRHRKSPDGNIASALSRAPRRSPSPRSSCTPKGNYQDLQRYASRVDLAWQADAEATLPMLIEEVKRQMPAARKSALEARGKAFADSASRGFRDCRRRPRRTAGTTAPSPCRACAWRSTSRSRTRTGRCVSTVHFQSSWPQQLWTADEHYQYIGGYGAAGIGYISPATSAPRSPIRSTAASASASSATAI